MHVVESSPYFREKTGIESEWDNQCWRNIEKGEREKEGKKKKEGKEMDEITSEANSTLASRLNMIRLSSLCCSKDRKAL